MNVRQTESKEKRYFLGGLISSVQITLIYEHLFYKYLVRWTVSQAMTGRNVTLWKYDFLRPLDIRLIFSVHIPLINEHL